MSEFYDSLEDDSNDSECYSDSLKQEKKNLVKDLSNETPNKYSFYLSRNVPEERENIFPNFQLNRIQCCRERKNFLPKVDVKRGREKVVTSRKAVIDPKILDKQGLQFNDDGSFTKSPRSDTDKLPFITREYRNLQLQKKKTYQLNKNASERPRKKSVPRERLLNAIKSNQPVNIKEDGGNKEKSNLTDAMKEKLLRNQTESPSVGNEKTKCVGSFCQNEKILKYPNVNLFNETNKKPKRNTKCNIYKYQSDIILKPKLNYTERHLMGKGFNPLHLRHWSEKVISNTNRSNFGDSTMDELSGVSSKSYNYENGINEDEELFYKKLMERDRQQNQCSARSEGVWNLKQLGELKDHARVKHNLRSRRKTKSLSIDLSPERSEKSHSAKKPTHYCSSHPSSNLSKSELALKAKTYGYLVNARNIFKLKTQAEAKVCPDVSTQPKTNLGVDDRVPTRGVGSKERSAPKISREGKKSAGRNSNTNDNFFLPHVKNLRGGQIQSEVLQRVSSCLKNWNDLS